MQPLRATVCNPKVPSLLTVPVQAPPVLNVLDYRVHIGGKLGQGTREFGSDPPMTKSNVKPPRIADRPHTAETLRLTQYAVDLCSTAIAWIRSNGRVVYTNEAQRRLLGYSEKEMQSMSVSDVDPDWPAEAWATGWQRFREAGVMTFETRHRRKDGHVFPVEVTANYLEWGGEEYLFAFVTDITERKRAERELRTSETKLQAIFDHHYQLTGLLDSDGRLLAANKTALGFADANELEVIGQYFWDTPWWDPAQIPTVQQAIHSAANGEFVRFECTHTRADGEIREFDFSLSPVQDEEGNVVYLVPEGRDITQLKRAQKQLHEHDSMIRDIVETSRDWIWSIDLQGIHTYCNPAIEAILGYPPDELVGKSSLDLIHEEDRKLVQAEFSSWISERRGWKDLVLRWEHKDGSYRYLESNAVPIVGVAGELLGFRGVDRDITDRLDAEEKLAGMEARLDHVARLSAMGQMTAGIAHELGQPLYAIVNFANASCNLLEAEVQTDLSDLREWNSAIVKSAERAADIVRRMRTFARRGESERSTCHIHDIVREVVQLVAFEARRCRATVQLELPESSPNVEVARVQIQQVLVNLLRNALESMEDGGSLARVVTIRVETEGESIRISVADTGPGLGAADNQEMFEPFVTNRKDGLGLGLAISSSIIQAHGGELWAESEEGAGATFHFTLPALHTDSDHPGQENHT